MNPYDILKAFGPSGLIGLVIGIGLVAVFPTNNKGAAFLILLAVCMTMLASLAIKAIRRAIGKGNKPPGQGSGDPN